MTICQCGALTKWAAVPGIPIHFDKHVGMFRVNLTQTITRDLSFCFSCGGSPALRSVPECQCDQLAEWVGIPGSCIRYDPDLNEYSLWFGQGAILIFYYCPHCGGRLSGSKRDKLFGEISQDEKAALKERLKGAKTLSEVRLVLGEPTEQRSHFNHSQLIEAFGHVGLKEMIRYSNAARSFDIIAQELLDGKFQIIYLPKLK